MPARMLVLMALGALALTAPTAGGQSGGLDRKTLVDVQEEGPAEIQLDQDAPLERVSSRKLEEFRYAPRIEDECAGAKSLGPVNENVAIETVNLRGAQIPPLLFTSGSSGATGRAGHFRMHSFGPPNDARGCSRLRTLFAYPSTKFPLPRPRRGTEAGSFSASPRAVGGEIQIRTVEGLYRRRDGGCCPSFLRTSDWRLNPETFRYQRIRSRTRRAHR